MRRKTWGALRLLRKALAVRHQQIRAAGAKRSHRLVGSPLSAVVVVHLCRYAWQGSRWHCIRAFCCCGPGPAPSPRAVLRVTFLNLSLTMSGNVRQVRLWTNPCTDAARQRSGLWQTAACDRQSRRRSTQRRSSHNIDAVVRERGKYVLLQVVCDVGGTERFYKSLRVWWPRFAVSGCFSN